MPQQRILHPAWRESLEPTPYPFGDWATLSNAGGVFIPEGTFLDASVYPIGGGIHLRLSKAMVGAQTIRLFFGDDLNDELCFGDIDLVAMLDDVRLEDQYGRPAGLLVSEASRLAVLQTWPPGLHVFTYAQTGLSSLASILTPEVAFRGFLLEDGSIVAGDVWLVGDDGIVLSASTDDSTDPSTCVLQVDVVGDPLFRRRLCATSFSTPRFLKTITIQSGCRKIVCRPDDQGDFKISVGSMIVSDTILRIHNTSDGIMIEAAGEAQTTHDG